MRTRFIFIHGNGTTNWAFAFAPWLKDELEKLGFETVFTTFPDPQIARSKYWLPYIKNELKTGKNDVIIGWSSGAVAAMRFAESNKLRGSILISPCHTDLGNKLEKISGYYDKPWAWEKIKKNQQKIALIYGDNDPYIPQREFEYITSQLKPKVIKISDGKHFVEYQEFPQLLSYIKSVY